MDRVSPNRDLDARCQRFLVGRPRTSQYAARTSAELNADVNRLTDLLVDLVRERDELLIKGESQKMWIRVLFYAVIAEWGLIGWLATELFSRLK